MIVNPSFNDSAPPASVAAPPPPDAPVRHDAPTLESLERQANQATFELATARQALTKRLRSSRRFKSRLEEIDRLEQALERARKVGTAQEKLAASTAWNKARLAMENDQQAVAMSKDATIRALEAESNRLTALVSLRRGALRAEEVRKAAALEAEERAEGERQARRNRAIGELAIGAMGQLRGGVTINQILGEAEMLVSYNEDGDEFDIEETTLILRGLSTSGKADGQRISLGPVMVTGTQQYVTVLGATRTVFVVEPAP